MEGKYLLKDESTTIKGILIILIVFGHINQLVSWPSPLFTWLYSFHVWCFFILPFFYKPSDINSIKGYIQKMAVRTGIPYLSTFIICLALQKITVGEIQFDGVVLSFFSGSGENLSKYIGASFLWFLPTYFSISVFLVLADKYKSVRITLLLIGLYLWCIELGLMHFYERHCILGIPLAVKYYFMGFICKLLLDKYSNLKGIYICAFFIFTLCVFIIDYKIGGVISNLSLFAVIGAFTVLAIISHIVKNKLLTLFGKYSMTIYLLHLFIYHFLLKSLSVLKEGILEGIILYILTLSIALLLSLIIDHIPCLRKLYMPRDFKEFINFYKKY